MSELLDTFDENGNKTGTIEKGQHTDDYVKCCSCFVVNGKNQVLVEKRGNTVLDAGKLDLCSGHVQSGEITVQGMIREIKEELGIEESECYGNIKKMGTVTIDFSKVGADFKCFTDVFLLKRKKETLALQDEEVKGIEYYPIEEVFELIREGKTRIPYDQDIEKFEEIFEKIEQELGIKQQGDNKDNNKDVMER